MSLDDPTIDCLLELNNTRYVIDDQLGLWVKFEVTQYRPHGVKYALSLHDRFNRRIMAFDNAHAIQYGGKNFVSHKRTYYHWHRDENDNGQPYIYVNAGKLLEDFWREVERILKQIRGF